MKTTRICAKADEERLLDSNEWMLVTKNEEFLQSHPSEPATSGDDRTVPLWTDQYSNLFQILSGGFW